MVIHCSWLLITIRTAQQRFAKFTIEINQTIVLGEIPYSTVDGWNLAPPGMVLKPYK